MALSGGEPALSKENQGSRVREGCGGSEVSAYPALAESDIPPSLPHRAEAAATHAAQDLLVSIPFHLGGEEMHVLLSRNAAHLASQRHWAVIVEPEISRYKHISHPSVAWNVATRSSNRNNNRVMLLVTHSKVIHHFV